MGIEVPNYDTVRIIQKVVDVGRATTRSQLSGGNVDIHKLNFRVC